MCHMSGFDNIGAESSKYKEPSAEDEVYKETG